VKRLDLIQWLCLLACIAGLTATAMHASWWLIFRIFFPLPIALGIRDLVVRTREKEAVVRLR
jgi:hypothetical protein